jgi:phage terminase large subunit-like protein
MSRERCRRIVASALLHDGRFAVLADRTTTGSPAQWGEAVVRCHDDFDADDVVVEVNFGGDMATPKWSSRPLNACTNAASATQT